MILTFDRPHVLDLKVCHRHINQLVEILSISWLVSSHFNIPEKDQLAWLMGAIVLRMLEYF